MKIDQYFGSSDAYIVRLYSKHIGFLRENQNILEICIYNIYIIS